MKAADLSTLPELTMLISGGITARNIMTSSQNILTKSDKSPL